MATHWKEWERKVGRVFENIGFTKIASPEKPGSLQPRTFCLERLNQEMQVDVFVRVDQHRWILMECRDRRNRTIKKWLHEVAGRAKDRLAKLKKELGIQNLEVFGVAATSLRDLDSKTLATAEDTGVALWHHGVVDYLMAITKVAGAQVEELVLQRCGLRRKDYPDIKLQVWQWPKSSEPWFIGFVSPLQIAHATFVYQRGQGFGERAYQRFLKPQRIVEIADFVKSGKVFPNSIVLALPQDTKIPRAKNQSGLVTISIPGKPEAIKIIDGQHRFFGALASGKDPKLLCTFVRADELDQAIMFAKINGKQVSVNKSQLISLFGIPGFAAKIASGASQRDQEKIEREETIYRTLVRMNEKGPLANRLNFYPGRPAHDTIPFKFLYDTAMAISKVEQSGFGMLRGSPRDRGRVFGDRLSAFLSAWQKLIGKEHFFDTGRWFQPTMLSALLLTYPDCRWEGQDGRRKLEADAWLVKRSRISWNPRPEAYRGAAGARKLAKALCKRIGIKARFV
jgi:DGQHR domain-containing protein